MSTTPRPLVMVIESDYASRAVIVRTLQRNGYEVTECETGSDALTALHRRPKPIAILLDLALQNDAYGFLAIQKHLEGYRDTPIIVMSDRSDVEIMARQINAVGWLQKPIQSNDILEVIGALRKTILL